MGETMKKMRERLMEENKLKDEEKRKKDEIAARLAAEKKAREYWSPKELDTLVKAVMKFPGGTVDRWLNISLMLNTGRTQEEVIKKVKQLSKEKRRPPSKSSKTITKSPKAEKIE